MACRAAQTKETTNRFIVECRLRDEALLDHGLQFFAFGTIERHAAKFDADAIDFEKPDRWNHRANVEKEAR